MTPREAAAALAKRRRLYGWLFGAAPRARDGDDDGDDDYGDGDDGITRATPVRRLATIERPAVVTRGRAPDMPGCDGPMRRIVEFWGAP